MNGVNGRKITSKSNGKSIFLPAAGFRTSTSLYDAGSFGYYWSRSLGTGHSSYAYGLGFFSHNIYGYGYYRSHGRSVRPVHTIDIEKQVYTVFDEGTLTYYYDDQMDSRSGEKEVYDQSDGLRISYKSDVLEANITPSMKDAPLTSTDRMFYGLSNMTSIHGLENLNTANVTNMSDMFYGCQSLTSLDVSSFNTENVTSMGAMFSGCSSLTSLDLSSFNTENVPDMNTMFYGCSSLTSLDLSSFNTENVTSMSFMFSSCYDLTSLDLSSFNTENVSDMSSMFYGCSSLTSLDLSSFNTENVMSMSSMFSDCRSLTSLDLSSFNTENVQDMSWMFSDCQSLTSLDLSSFNTENVTSMSKMFSSCENLTTIICDDDWSKSSVLEDSEDMFDGCTSLVGGKGTAYDSNFTDATYACPDGGTESPGYFTKKPQVYTEFDEATGTLTYYYDDQMSSRSGVTELYDPVNNPDAVRFTGYYKKVTKAVIDPSMKDAPLTSMRNMFYGGFHPETFVMQSLRNMTSIEGLENLNTSTVTDMNNMFGLCQSLTTLDLSSFNTSKVTTFNGMFQGCENLKMVDVSSFDINKVRDMGMMFLACTKLTTICCDKDWSNSTAESGYMFSGCTSLVGGNGTAFDSNVIDATYARPDGGTASPGYFTAGVVGDVNGDGEVNLADAQTILGLMAKDEYKTNADVNNDTSVDLADYQTVLGIMAKQ